VVVVAAYCGWRCLSEAQKCSRYKMKKCVAVVKMELSRGKVDAARSSGPVINRSMDLGVTLPGSRSVEISFS